MILPQKRVSISELNRLKPVIDARNSQITYQKRWANLSKIKIKPKEV
jgi:hypothetical protein